MTATSCALVPELPCEVIGESIEGKHLPFGGSSGATHVVPKRWCEVEGRFLTVG